jgi:structure-specific recognition protein 1
MAWKGEQGEGVVAMATADIKWAQWLRVARNFQLRVGLKDRRREIFDGFMREVRYIDRGWKIPQTIFSFLLGS